MNLLKDSRYETLERKMKQKLEEWFARYVDPAIDGAKEPVFGSGKLVWRGCGAKAILPTAVTITSRRTPIISPIS